MAAFRFIAWVLVSVAVALLGADAISSLEHSEPVVRTSAEIMGLFGVNAQAIVDASPGAIAKALSTLMNLPLWSVIGIIGVVLTLIFRPME